ncbi:MAG: hypothetical protein AB1649_17115 [Chloroflexota bacterium]
MKHFRFSHLLYAAMLLGLAACQTQAPSTPAPTETPLASAITQPAQALMASPTPTPLVFDELAQQFEYDSAAPLNIQDLSQPDLEQLKITLPEGVNLSEISYDAPGGAVRGYLVKPAGDGPFAAVSWGHKYPGSNVQFLEEAVSLAPRGVVSLLVEGRYPGQVVPGNFNADCTSIINQVLDLRRGLDVLLATPGVDAARLAYVGHDYGAMHGAILAGVDKRVKAYVLTAFTGSYFDWRLYFGALPAADLREYARLAPTLAPLTYIPHAAPARLFLQFGATDRYVSQERAEQLIEAASEPKQVQTYAAGHDLDETARTDREAFLIETLALP